MEEDYMSDKFIEEMEKIEQANKIKKKFNPRKKFYTKPEANKVTKVNPLSLETKHREEGLSTSIPSTNKGFAMLTKMGYKPGQGIGKEESGISEPITIDVKNNRHGLGRKSKKEHAELAKQFQQQLAQKMDNSSMDTFRHRLSLEKTKKLMEADLRKSQRMCKQFDEKSGLIQAEEIFFWPEIEDEVEKDEVNDEDKVEIPVNYQLNLVTKYLREQYYYCIWCAVNYNDKEDLDSNCPGSERTDH